MLCQKIGKVIRGTIQSPKTPLSAAFDLLQGSNTSTTGEVVDGTKALSIPAYWKGVNLICRGVGKTPLVTYERLGNGQNEAKYHPTWRLLKKISTGDFTDNPMSAFTFKQTVMGNALNYGNGFAYIVRNTMYQPQALIWLNPLNVVPMLENGKLLYLVTLNSGEIRRLLPMDVLHIKGLSFDGVTGYSVTDVLKDCLGLNIAYQKSQAYFFRNAMRPGWVIQVPWRFKDNDAVQEFRKRLGRVHQGLEKSHIPAILENGAEAKPLSMTHDDAQFMQSREFDLRMIANVLFLPPSKIGDNSRTAYNSLEQENQSTLDEAFDPWFVAWENECEFKLLLESEKALDTHTIKFNRNSLIQVAFQTKIEGYNKAVLSGWLSRDEIRSKEEMNPIPNGEGSLFYVPQNVKFSNSENEEESNTEKPNEEEQTNSIKIDKVKLLADYQLKLTIDRCVGRIVTQARVKSVNPTKFMDWLLNDMVERNIKVLSNIVEPILMVCRILNDNTTDIDISKVLSGWLIELRDNLNDLTGLVSKDKLFTEVDKFLVKDELMQISSLLNQFKGK